MAYEPLTVENGLGDAELKACFFCDPGPENEKCGLCDHIEEAIRRLHEFEKREVNGACLTMNFNGQVPGT